MDNVVYVLISGKFVLLSYLIYLIMLILMLVCFISLLGIYVFFWS